jgi:hypothetical protein
LTVAVEHELIAFVALRELARLPQQSSSSTAGGSREHTEEDIAAVKASGLSEDQIFELVVCAAIGQATRQYDTAFAALDTATERNDYASRNPR